MLWSGRVLRPPSEDVWTQQHATAGHGRGQRNFAVFIVGPVGAVCNSRCLVYTNAIILQRVTALRGIFLFKPDKYKKTFDCDSVKNQPNNIKIVFTR